jgi:hypothetical protein
VAGFVGAAAAVVAAADVGVAAVEVAAVVLPAAGVAAGVAVPLQPTNTVLASSTKTKDKTMARDFFITLLLNLFLNKAFQKRNVHGKGLTIISYLSVTPSYIFGM